jgi:hypothetical protein
MFYEGQKVRCWIKPEPENENDSLGDFVQVGGVYTVKSIQRDWEDPMDYWLWLEGDNLYLYGTEGFLPYREPRNLPEWF